MKTSRKQRLQMGLSGAAVLLLLLVGGSVTWAQSGEPNPTPITITLTPLATATPSAEPTATPTVTPEDSLPPDRFEPNDDARSATPIGLGLEPDLTLLGDDVDAFTLYLKAGQLVQVSTYVRDGVDTRLRLHWNGQVVAENDDRSPADVGSTVVFPVPTDGWIVILVEKATVYDGAYDLEASLAEPTATPTPTVTPTPSPTLTPTPSPTPPVQADTAEPNDTPETARPVAAGVRATYTLGPGDVDYFSFIAKAGNRYTCETVTGQVDTLLTVVGVSAVIGVNDDREAGRIDSSLDWSVAAEQPVVVKVEARGGGVGAYEFVCQAAAPAPSLPMPLPPTPAGVGPSPTPVTATASLTEMARLPLTLRHVGRVQPAMTAPTTRVRLLVYYDANNDRAPGPGEGVANVSVLAVDVRGQPLARVFTNAQGEAIFNLSGDAVARVVVPFVPGWSERIRVGEVNDDVVLGLPAVRLPVFLPVQNLESE